MEEMWRYAILLVTLLACSQHVAARTWELQTPIDETQPLSKIFLERATLELDASISINADPILLGQQVGLLLQNIKFLLMALSVDIMGFKDAHYSASPHIIMPSLCWQGETAEWVTVTFKKPVGASETDWIGVFSPAKFKYT